MFKYIIIGLFISSLIGYYSITHDYMAKDIGNGLLGLIALSIFYFLYLKKSIKKTFDILFEVSSIFVFVSILYLSIQFGYDLVRNIILFFILFGIFIISIKINK